MTKEPRGTRGVVCAALVAAICCIPSGSAGAQGVNFDVLIETLKQRANPGRTYPSEAQSPGAEEAEVPGPARKLEPVQELAEFTQCLKAGRCRFLPDQTGEEAATRLGYSRLFASAYAEVLLRARALDRDKQPVNPTRIVTEFESILQEEQAIDRLIASDERHTIAIAYLRALQNGDVPFPDPQLRAPPQLLLLGMMYSYPEVSFDINDDVFGSIYRATRTFAADRVRRASSVSVYEVIGEFRRQIVGSAQTASDAISPACQKGTAIGNLVAISQFCRRLRLSDTSTTTSGEVERSPEALLCQAKSWAALKSELEVLPVDDDINLCGLIEQRVSAGREEGFSFRE
jgi:hypothetical protein